MEVDTREHNSRIWHKTVGTFIGFFGLLLVLLALAQNRGVQQWLIGSIIEKGKEHQLSINITHSRGFFPLNSTFEGVSIQFLTPSNAQAALSIDTVRYHWKFSDIANGSIGLDYVEVLGFTGEIIYQDTNHISGDRSVLKPSPGLIFGRDLTIGQLLVRGDSFTLLSRSQDPASKQILGGLAMDSLRYTDFMLRSRINVLNGVMFGGIDRLESLVQWKGETVELSLSTEIKADSTALKFDQISFRSNLGSYEGEINLVGDQRSVIIRRMELLDTFYDQLLPYLISEQWKQAFITYSLAPKNIRGELGFHEGNIQIKELLLRQNDSQIRLNGEIFRDESFKAANLNAELSLAESEIPVSLIQDYPMVNWTRLKDYNLLLEYQYTPRYDSLNIVLRDVSGEPVQLVFSQDYQTEKKIREKLSDRSILLQFNNFTLAPWLTETHLSRAAEWDGLVRWNRNFDRSTMGLDSISMELEHLRVGAWAVQNVTLKYEPVPWPGKENMGIPLAIGDLSKGGSNQDPEGNNYRLQVTMYDDSGSIEWDGAINRLGNTWQLQSQFTGEHLRWATNPSHASGISEKLVRPDSDADDQFYANTMYGILHSSGEGFGVSEVLFNANTPLLQTPDTSFTDAQFYADYLLNEDGLQELRITSTPFDFQLRGRYRVKDFPVLTEKWMSYLRNEQSRWMLKGVQDSRLPDTTIRDAALAQQMEWQLHIKESEALGFLLPAAGIQHTKMMMNGRMNVDESRMLMNLDVFDEELRLNGWLLDSLNGQWTASFRIDSSSLDFSVLESRGQLKALESPSIRAQDLQWQASMQADSIRFSHKIGRLPSGAFLSMDGEFQATDTLHRMRLQNFRVGSGNYIWSNLNDLILSLDPRYRLGLEQVSFHNNEEELDIRGFFSSELQDSMLFTIQSVNLDRLSELLNVQQDLNGIVDGQFSTRSLLENPNIQGELDIKSFSLNQQIVGDIRLRSEFNPNKKQFDTNVTIYTDSLLYPEYFSSSERVGQNVELNGYFKALDTVEALETDTLYYFDLNFANIDLWILPFLTPNVFSEMSGVASGTGSIWGNDQGYDFIIDYDIGSENAVFIQPRFLETYYYGTGPLRFSSSEGLVFNDFFLMDPSGGTAHLNGTYNLNRFGPLHTIDLSLEMEEFHFLNTFFDEELPFFGQGYGTAILRMTGTNDDPVLYSEGPILMGDFSSIGLPLIEKTEFEENNKFIRFVDDFSLISEVLTSNRSSFLNGQTMVMETNEERSFTERFTLDLQFESATPMTVQLIFDPITGDVITANGTGNIRIQLQDEDFSVFGQFDISSGDYNFVSGDIFTRRFELIPGGTLRWDGDPLDAKLDLQALYQARPDINTLTRTRDQINQDQAERVPVELVLNIGGSLQGIENDFFFRLPNTFETQQNSTLKTQINALNRNEDEKLIQATSFLLMGDFIPSSTALTDATNTLTSNLSGSAAVLNPLLSSQLISPLLSNQMNSLLRSDVGSLDIDFNLNTYNNIDLGLALRLYNDRIILSREGQITGSQSSIGDIGATYKINQALALTAFHRQDPTFSNYSGSDNSQQSQDINGVGIETEVSFSSWKQLLTQIFEPIAKFFNRREEEILVQAE